MGIPEPILKWFKTWGLLIKAASGIIGVVAYWALPPPTVLGEDNSIDFLTKSIVVVLLILGFILSLALNKYYHYKVWLLISVICLSCCIGYFLFNPQSSWVCTFQDGQRFVMGYTLTEEGKEQIKKPYCQGCEALIGDCGPKPEDIWTLESINWVRRLLFLAYFSVFPFVVFLMIGVVQVLSCLSPPNPRKEIMGKWYGQAPNNKFKVTLVITESNGRKVSGYLNRQHIGDDESILAETREDINTSSFWHEHLYVSSNNKVGMKKYRIITSSVLRNRVTLESYDKEKKKYLFHCELNKVTNPEASTDLTNNVAPLTVS